MKRPPLSLSLLLAFSVFAQAETYVFDVERTGNAKPWSSPATWIGAPSSFPNGANDNISYSAFATTRQLVADQTELHVGTFSYTGAVANAATQRIVAATGVQTSLQIDTLNHTAAALLLFTNSASEGASLSVSIGNLTVATGGTLEVGHPDAGSLEAFNVTGSSTIGGTFLFDGIKGRTEGQNRVSLGALDLTGLITLGSRQNSGGVLALTALTGNGIIQLINADGYTGNSGTVEITTAAGETSTFDGRLRTSSRSEATAAKLSLVKKGTGTQILSGQLNNYSGGTVIEAGTLAVTNTKGSALGVGAVTVQDGATLAGSGLLALEEAATVQKGGTIAASAHLVDQVATLTFSGAAREGAAILSMEEDAAFGFRFMDGGESDRIAFLDYTPGGLTLNSAGIAVNAVGLTEGSYTLFTFNHIETSELENLAGLLRAGSGFEGYQAAFDYAENAITLNVTAIPEPGGVALGTLTLIGLFFWRRF